MRKASRLFEIVQMLRLAKRPLTASEIADRLEVAQRSIYRDIAALQAMRVPIEGERGIGYILRPGFTLPPLMFTVEQAEAIVLALALLNNRGDTDLRTAAKQVLAKISAAVPAPLQATLETTAIRAWGAIAADPPGIDLGLVRRAIREERKLSVAYRDESGRDTSRIIRPLALIYYADATNIVAWCELRQAIRHFRAERVRSSEPLDQFFPGDGDRLRQAWQNGWSAGPPSIGAGAPV